MVVGKFFRIVKDGSAFSRGLMDKGLDVARAIADVGERFLPKGGITPGIIAGIDTGIDTAQNLIDATDNVVQGKNVGKAVVGFVGDQFKSGLGNLIDFAVPIPGAGNAVDAVTSKLGGASNRKAYISPNSSNVSAIAKGPAGVRRRYVKPTHAASTRARELDEVKFADLV